MEKSLRVLLVIGEEDEPENLVTELRLVGYEVTLLNGFDDIERPGFSLQAFDVVISDCRHLPPNGLLVARALAEESPHIPCLIYGWHNTVETSKGKISFPDIAEQHAWLTFHHREDLRLGFIWDFLTNVAGQQHC